MEISGNAVPRFKAQGIGGESVRFVACEVLLILKDLLGALGIQPDKVHFTAEDIKVGDRWQELGIHCAVSTGMRCSLPASVTSVREPVVSHLSVQMHAAHVAVHHCWLQPTCLRLCQTGMFSRAKNSR